jgi:regulator of protease activity HflC (stomatin/prohibitin superfamily)
MTPRIGPWLINGAVALVALYLIGYVGLWQWSICRVEVPPGSSLLLRYKGPFPFGGKEQAPEGTLVRLDRRGRPPQVGILEAMPGPGRHFYSPLEYEWQLVADTIIAPGEIGVLTSKVGKPLPPGEFLAEPGYRGIRRRVLTPGRYRINTYAFDVAKKPVWECVGSTGGVARRQGDALLIPPGYVGVVTNKAANPRTGETQGTQDAVLQPGLYYLNPAEKRVDILGVGYNQTTLEVERQRDAAGRPLFSEAPARPDGRTPAREPLYVAGRGIEFPSKEGFPIHLDFTAIWGILPNQAPSVIRQFGSVKGADADIWDVVEATVIIPQIGSICRLHGSRQGAVDLLVGDTREAFQTDISEELEAVLEAKHLTLLFGLVRHIYVPTAVREPLQRAKIADELKLTRDQEQLTAQAEGDLKEAKARVILEERRTKADTTKQVAQLIASGEKKAREIEATTEKLRAEIDAQTATVQAQVTTTLGEAEARKTQLANEAQAERYRQSVQALGGPDAYNRYAFAEGLPADLRLGVFYAGPGTFWTDLKGFEQVLLGKLATEAAAPPPPAPSGR